MNSRMFRLSLMLLCSGALTLGACQKAQQMKNKADAVAVKAEDNAQKAQDKAEQVEQQVDEGATQAALAAAVADPNRPELERARDIYRHPYETLMFFGIEPDDKVLELWPGRGWYTRILAPYVGANGALYVTNYSPDDPSEYRANSSKAYSETLAQVPNGSRATVITVTTPDTIDFGLENELDAVLTFRNVHNWMKDGSDATIYAQSFKALKSGGVFGIVEHRANPGITREESSKSGYVDQAALIAAVEEAGFKFVESSEINANSKDTKDYPEGVWTLPPSLRLKEKDADKYMQIGESDRMTLKFVKP